MKNGANKQGFALVIAHYNYELRFVVSGLRDFQSPRPLDQRVTQIGRASCRERV